MTPKEIDAWRKLILGHLDVLKSKVRQTRRYMKANNLTTLEDKSDLSAAWRRVYELFPEDLEPQRAGDLGRHLSFAELHDFRDIEEFDIPTVQRSIELYGRKGQQFIEHEVNQQELNLEAWELLHPQIREACMGHFKDRNYREAARVGIDLLLNETRRLSDRHDDGDSLIRSAVGVANQIGFSPNMTDSEKNITEGLMVIFQGLYKGIRNPCFHGYDGFSRIETFQILTMCSFLLSHMRRN